jgi:glycosyltransferase involved in cell wall biosynthesis
MKLFFVISSLGSGGAERVTASLANYWATRGWKVVVITMAAAEEDFYELHDSVERIALGLTEPSQGFFSALYNNLRRVFALYRILRIRKPDFAVGMMASTNVLLALAGYVARVRTIGSERVHPPELPLGRIWEIMRQRCYPLLGGIVAQTVASAEWLRQNAPAPVIAVIPNPIQFPIPEFAPRLSPGEVITELSANHVLLGAGRLQKQKGFDRLLDAFSELAKRFPDWGLVILGEGPLREQLTSQALRLGIAHRVAMPGSVGNIGSWYEAAALYALTSRFEGFPNTLVEALASGLPAVAVNCETGPREILRDGLDGILVPNDDQCRLISALAKMMSDASFREQCAAHAKAARKRYEITRVAEEWESMFRAQGG